MDEKGIIEIEIDKIIFREDLYPRTEKDPVIVQRYAEDITVLPPIEINQDNVIIDGWNRWQAHKKVGAETIRAFVTETEDDVHLMELAIERNAKFGLQLTIKDKQKIARDIYRNTNAEERGEKKQRLVEILSMSERTIDRWLARIDKDTKEETSVAIQNLWLQCYTREEIAESVGCTEKIVRDVLVQIDNWQIGPIPGQFTENLPKDSASQKTKTKWEKERQEKIIEYNQENSEHETDFDVPIYNVWKQQEKSEGVSHFGNTEARWLDNLLYLYTKPFDIVVDPFAGGGSTLDVCKQRFRRCWISDRLPIETRPEIRQHDIIDGTPDLRKRWSDVKLVYLDPPYWKQSEGKYSQDENDLANMSLDTFHNTLSNLIKSLAKKMHPQSYIALIIQPTQWKAEDRQFTDHIAAMLNSVKLKLNMRIQCPYESQQCTAQMVDWAKENKKLLVISRELIIWEII